jgi:sulfide:quinone oxidoreductase
MAVSRKHRVVVIGAGTAGLSTAARLKRAGIDDITILDPATTHDYQPLWTLAGGGLAPVEHSRRAMSGLIPKGVSWLREAAVEVDPENRFVTTESGSKLGYDRLVVAPGIQLDWSRVPGMSEALDTPSVCSNYGYELAPHTWEAVRSLCSGTAVFTMPSGPIKCAGAPQKIAYLAADYWRQQGVLDDIRVVLVLPTPGMFGVPVFARELERVARRYDIEVQFNSEAVAIDPDGKSVTITDNAVGARYSIAYDFLHVVPPQSAPDWLKTSPLAVPDNPAGWVDVDKHTLQHVRFPEVFALGDAGSTPNSKTGAAIRKQAPVVAANVAASLADKPLSAAYDGYASCPLTTARDRLLLAEFDYTLEPHPTLPLVDTQRERKDFGIFKRYALPTMYWNFMLKGLA